MGVFIVDLLAVLRAMTAVQLRDFSFYSRTLSAAAQLDVNLLL